MWLTGGWQETNILRPTDRAFSILYSVSWILVKHAASRFTSLYPGDQLNIAIGIEIYASLHFCLYLWCICERFFAVTCALFSPPLCNFFFSFFKNRMFFGAYMCGSHLPFNGTIILLAQRFTSSSDSLYVHIVGTYILLFILKASFFRSFSLRNRFVS